MINNKTWFPRLSLLGLVGDYLDYYFPVYLCLNWFKIQMIFIFHPFLCVGWLLIIMIIIFHSIFARAGWRLSWLLCSILFLRGLVAHYHDYYFPSYLCLGWLKIMMIIMFQPPLSVDLDEEDSIWRVKAEAHNKVFLINSDQWRRNSNIRSNLFWRNSNRLRYSSTWSQCSGLT